MKTFELLVSVSENDGSHTSYEGPVTVGCMGR